MGSERVAEALWLATERGSVKGTDRDHEAEMRQSPESLISETEALIRERQVLKLGGVLAVLGGLGYFITLLLHGDLPDQTTEIALHHIAGRPEWPALKLALIVSILLWVGAFVALAFSLSHGASWLLGRMAVACLLIGATVVVGEYSILGHELKKIADAWRGASGAAREHHLFLAEALLGVTSGPFLSFVAWLLGLPYVLMGLAIACGRGYPRWLGWLAVGGGAGALFAGTTRFLGLDLVPFAALYGGLVMPLNLWLAAMGVVMWRHGQYAGQHEMGADSHTAARR